MKSEKYFINFLCLIIIALGMAVTLFSLINSQDKDIYDTEYIPAEPLTHNQTQTVFTTGDGTYLADGLYPDGTYLLTIDGKDVLVVWQAVDGEVG